MTADRHSDTEGRLRIAEAELDRLLEDPDGNRKDIDTQVRIVRGLTAILATLARTPGAAASTPAQRIAAAVAKSKGATS